MNKLSIINIKTIKNLTIFQQTFNKLSTNIQWKHKQKHKQKHKNKNILICMLKCLKILYLLISKISIKNLRK